MIFLKIVLFIISSILSKICWQFFLLMCQIEINVYILCYVLETNPFDLYSFILNFFFLALIV